MSGTRACFLACLVIYILPSVFVLNKESVRIRYGFLTLSWADFISLVAKHKSDAFELDAEIDLADLELLGGNPDAENHEITRDIANKIWKTIGYQFV